MEEYKMLLNLSIIEDQMKSFHILQSRTEKLQDRTLKYPKSYLDENGFDSSVLYIVSSENLPINPVLPDHLALICLGFPPAGYVSSEICEFICISGSVELSQVFQTVLEIFYKFENLNERFKDMIIEKQSFDTFGRLCFNIFRTPVSAFGLFEKVLFIEYDRDREKEPSRYEGSQGDYLDDEERSILYADTEFQKTLDIHGPTFSKSDIYSSNIIFCNFFDQDHYIGRIMIEDSYREFQNGDYKLLEWVGEYLFLLLKQNREFHFNAPQEFENLVQNLLIGNLPGNEVKSNRILLSFGWNYDDTYICAAISHDPSSSLDHALNNAAFYLKEFLDANFIFIHDHKIYVIINLVKSVYSLPEIQRRLRIFQNNNALEVGLSTSFHNFYDLQIYIRQAKLMVSYAISKHFTCPAEFEKNVLSMMLNKIQGDSDVSVFISDNLRKLCEYDETNGTELLRTLRLYLDNNQSLSKTMNDLFIARSSCQYRINRIQEITNLTLEDPDTVLYLKLILKMRD